jgi:transcriptional regulator
LQRSWRDNDKFMGERKDKSGDLLQGTLDLLILTTVARGRMHGYAIAEAIEERSDEVLSVEEGALYPALHRLELRGWLSSEWGVSENNRRAKYYAITPAGKKQLAAEGEQWSRLAQAVLRVLGTA